MNRSARRGARRSRLVLGERGAGRSILLCLLHVCACRSSINVNRPFRPGIVHHTDTEYH